MTEIEKLLGNSGGIARGVMDKCGSVIKMEKECLKEVESGRQIELLKEGLENIGVKIDHMLEEAAQQMKGKTDIIEGINKDITYTLEPKRDEYESRIAKLKVYTIYIYIYIIQENPIKLRDVNTTHENIINFYEGSKQIQDDYERLKEMHDKYEGLSPVSGYLVDLEYRI